MTRPPFHAIFDVDGTMADTTELHYAAFSQTAKEVGFHFDRETFGRIFGMHNNQIFKLFCGADLPQDRLDAMADRKEEIVRQAARQHLLPIKGLYGFLTELEAARIPMAVGSSAPGKNLDVFLSAIDVLHRFDAIAHGDEVEHGKPDPGIFLLAAKKLKVPPAQCVVFEDAPAGVEAALRAGMKVVALTTNRTADFLASAQCIVADFTELSVDRIGRLFHG